MSFIEMDHIRKSFGSLEVLKDVTLHVETGEVISIIGPSGSGKSTFLRCLCQLETINSGSIVVDGQTMVSTPEGSSRAVYAPAADVRTICRRMGMCFQHFNLFPHMTVLDNILEAPRIVKKMKTEEIMPKAEELLKKVGLWDKRDAYPSRLSGGQQQRVAIARAIVSEPRLLLLDEPLSNLDAKLRVDMRSELKRLHHDTGSTIIYVTHDQVEALTMSTKIALFREGELVQVDKPLELYDNPCDLYTADFIGNPSINFVEASGTAGASGLSVDGVMGRLEFSREDMTPEAPASGDLKLVLGIRPEQITISREKTDAAQVEARVYAGMPAGSETLVSVRVGEKLITVKELGSTHYAGDETVYLSYPPKKVNVFDASTKRLIKYSR